MATHSLLEHGDVVVVGTAGAGEETLAQASKLRLQPAEKTTECSKDIDIETGYVL